MTDTNPMRLPLGDPSFFEDLSNRSGVVITRELISSAPLSVRKELVQIATALKNRDSAELQSICHALKGACYSMQAHRLAYFVREMELVSSDIGKSEILYETVLSVGEETISWWHYILLHADYLKSPDE